MNISLEDFRFIFESISKPEILGEVTVAHTRFIKARLRDQKLEENSLNRGTMLAEILKELIENLKPVVTTVDSYADWIPYLVGRAVAVSSAQAGLDAEKLLQHLRNENTLSIITGNHNLGSNLVRLTEELTDKDINQALRLISERCLRWLQLAIVDYELDYTNELDLQRGLHERFIGRHKEMEILRNIIEHDRMVFIVGPRGVGKTSLCTNFAVDYARENRYQVFWYQLRQGDKATVDSFLDSLAHFFAFASYNYDLLHVLKLNDPKYNIEMKTQLLWQELENSNYVICIDDLHLINDNLDFQAFLNELSSRITNSQTNSKFIFLSRAFPFIERVQKFQINLTGLNYSDTVEFLTEKVATLSDEQIKEIYRLTNGNPKLLDLLLTNINYKDQHERLLEITTQYSREDKDIEAGFLTEVARLLTPQEQSVIYFLTVASHPVTLESVHTVLGEPKQDIESVLETLQEKNLVDISRSADNTNYYSIHDLPQEFFSSQVPFVLYQTICTKLATYYKEHDKIPEAIESLINGDELEQAYTLISENFDSLLKSNKPEVLLRILNRLGTSENPYVSYLLGILNFKVNDHNKAINHLLNYIETTDYEPQSLLYLAQSYRTRLEFTSAIYYIEQLESLPHLYKTSELMLNALIEKIRIFNQGANFDQGVSLANDVLKLIEGLTARDNEIINNLYSQIYLTLSAIYRKKGSWRESVQYGELGLKHLKHSELLPRAGVHLELGTSLWNQSKWKIASDNIVRSLKIFELKGDVINTARSYNILGLIAWNKGDWDAAEGYYLNGLKHAKLVNHILYVGVLLENLGALYYDQQKDYAEQYLDNAIAVLHDARDYQAYAKFYKGLYLRDRGELEKGLTLCQEALKIFEEAKYSLYYLGMLHREIGLTYVLLDKPLQGWNHIETARKMHEQDSGSFYQLAKTYWVIGRIHGSQNDIAKAMKAYSDAIEIFDLLGCTRYTNYVKDKIAELSTN